MAKAFKKMVYFDAEQERRIKQLARAAKTSETEIVRRAVDALWEREAALVADDARRIAIHRTQHPDGWPDDPTTWFRG